MVARVMVVDDDVVARMVLMHMIDGCGPFDIVEAEDGLAAWQAIRAGPAPALVFCDLRMPGMSGMEVLQRVRAEPALRTLPFVLLSAAADRPTMEEASDLGASAYLVKPVLPEQVRAILARWVAAGPDPAPPR